MEKFEEEYVVDEWWYLIGSFVKIEKLWFLSEFLNFLCCNESGIWFVMIVNEIEINLIEIVCFKWFFFCEESEDLIEVVFNYVLLYIDD